ncbi:MAG: dihydroorotase, partial [Planctomycetota bacterium]
MAESYLIENGLVVDPSQNIDRVMRVLIHDGVIAALDPTDGFLPPDCIRIDAQDCVVAPGLVDLGAELGEPGYEEDEEILSGTMAALAGGFTSIACSAYTDPPIDTAAAVEFVR